MQSFWNFIPAWTLPIAFSLHLADQLRFTPVPAVQHPVPDARYFDGCGESLGTFEALDVVEVGGLLKVNVPQGRLDAHHHLAGFDVESNTAGVCLVHKTPVLADRALIGVAAEHANAALCQHPLDQGDAVLEGVQDDGQVPVALVIQATVEARGREALYILNAMVTVRKQGLPQADDDPTVN